MDMNESNLPTGDVEKVYSQEIDDLNTYELLCELLPAKHVRALSRLLRELGSHADDSFPFALGLLSVTQLRSCAKLPHTLATVLENHRSEMKSTLEEFRTSLKPEGARAVVQEYAEVSPRLRTSWMGWPLNRQYTGRVGKGFQKIVAFCEANAAYKARWILAACVVTCTTVCASVQHRNARAAHLLRQEQASFYDNLQNEEAAKTAEIRKQDFVDAEQWAREQIDLRLQNLEPSSYRLAQQLERSSRLVRQKDGTDAWEVKLSKEVGFLSAGFASDPIDFSPISYIYLRYDPNRLRLSVTAPATLPATSPSKSDDKLKHH